MVGVSFFKIHLEDSWLVEPVFQDSLIEIYGWCVIFQDSLKRFMVGGTCFFIEPPLMKKWIRPVTCYGTQFRIKGARIRG